MNPRHHLFALKLLGWVLLMCLWAVAFCLGMFGLVLLGEHLAEHLPEATWWVFWPSAAIGLIYWLGYGISKEKDQTRRRREGLEP